MFRFVHGFRALLGVFLCFSRVVPPVLLEEDPLATQGPNNGICDDGKVGEDVGDIESWKCRGDHFQITKFLQPSYYEECRATIEEATVKCMNIRLSYNNHLPSSGDYRPLRPKYGEYEHLPPQRWLSALKYGAVVFLYHPCTPVEQVAQLRQLVQGCLWRHFITPYPHLHQEWPMALVSWGCVLGVRWVEPEELRQWISSHALHTPTTAEITSDGVYEDGLIHRAERVEVDGKEVACPQVHSPPTLPGIPTPTTHNASDRQELAKKSVVVCPTPVVPIDSTGDPNHDPLRTNHSVTCPPATTCCATEDSNPHLFLHHHVGYSILILVACIALLCAFVLFTWNLCTSGGRGRKRSRAKYKSVSKFFPFSYGQQSEDGTSGGGEVGVAIPEYGLPKTGQAEREKLLNESDEDEI